MARHFHEHLDSTRTEVQRLGAKVIEMIPRGTQALLDGDLALAEAIIESDDEINEMSRRIEEDLQLLLATQQPVALDLRAILASLRMVAEIERSADLVVNIAKAARRLFRAEIDPRMRGLISKMSDQAHLLYRFAIDAYAQDDAPLAAALHDMDDNLDLLQADFIVTMFRVNEQGGIDLQTAVQLAMVCRFYERIGDHAVNIGERVQYLVEGEIKSRYELVEDGTLDGKPQEG